MEAPDLHQPRTTVDLHPRNSSRTTSVVISVDPQDTDPVGDLPDGEVEDVVDFVADLHQGSCEVDPEDNLDLPCEAAEALDPHLTDLEVPEVDLVDPVDHLPTVGVEILDLLAAVDLLWVWVDPRHIGADLEAGTSHLAWKMDLPKMQKWRPKRTLAKILKRLLMTSMLTSTVKFGSRLKLTEENRTFTMRALAKPPGNDPKKKKGFES